MVIFYDIDTKKIRMVEHNFMFPTLPANMTKEEIIKYYKDKENMSFISMLDTDRPDGDVFAYDLIFDDNGEFKELKLKEELYGK